MEISKLLGRPYTHLLITLVIFAVLSACNSAPVTSDQAQAITYLSRFGNLNPSVTDPSNETIDEATGTTAILDFQSFLRLDAAGSKWNETNITYKISKYPRLLQWNDVDDEIAKAFALWSRYTDLSFTQIKDGKVHIEVRFEEGDHGDGRPFDGPRGILAHESSPSGGGVAHFDDAEEWTIDSYRGTNLFQVAAHVFGHTLGLGHSYVSFAVMFPFYQNFSRAFRLDTDDIEGIQSLYGKKTTVTSTETPGFFSSAEISGDTDENLCLDSKINTIFSSSEGSTYVFKGDYYWKLDKRGGVVANYPRLIANSWTSLPGNIDATFTHNGKTYFFKGSEYWMYDDKMIDGEYPKNISDGFPGIPDNLDAALVWSGNGKIYFFKGSMYWRFDPTQRPPVKSTYPKLLSNWKGVPDNIDAALQYTNGYTYFFKDGVYYKFNDKTFSIEAAESGYFRSTAYWWFGCRR